MNGRKRVRLFCPLAFDCLKPPVKERELTEESFFHFSFVSFPFEFLFGDTSFAPVQTTALILPPRKQDSPFFPFQFFVRSPYFPIGQSRAKSTGIFSGDWIFFPFPLTFSLPGPRPPPTPPLLPSLFFSVPVNHHIFPNEKEKKQLLQWLRTRDYRTRRRKILRKENQEREREIKSEESRKKDIFFCFQSP